MHYAAVASKYIWANFIVIGAQKSMCLMSVETSLSKVDTGNHISAAHETPCDLIQVFGKDKDLSFTSNKFRDQGIGRLGEDGHIKQRQQPQCLPCPERCYDQDLLVQ